MSGRRLPKQALIVLATLMVASLGLSGCMTGTWLETPRKGGGGGSSGGGGDGTTVFDQQVLWEDCGQVADKAECATIQAPLDWTKPDGETIDIALARLAATEPSQKIGSLLLNPGGPGASGIELLEYFSYMAGDAVIESFDLVGFDPRGVGASAAVTCYQTTEELDAFFAAHWPATPQGLEESRQIVEPFAEACAKNTGPLLGHVDTGSAARDMDLIRAVLGDDKLYYLGYSYGTELGAVYADLFPDKVGRLVLDGAVDPSLPTSAQDVAQARGFQMELEAYVEDCLAGGNCPLSGTKDQALGQIKDLLKQIEKKPLPTGGQRELTLPLAINGLLVTMYDDTAWYVLTGALQMALEGDGAGLLSLSDHYLDRDANAGYTTNAMQAFVAIGCLDSRAPADLSSVAAQGAALTEAAPTFGEYWGYSEMLCEVWPYPQVGELGPVSAPGADPILVIGTTGDPATPYEWAESLANQLDSGVLLTYEGHGHTAYGRSNDCIGEAVDAYLVEGVVPAEGTVC